MAGSCQIYESATYSGRLLDALQEMYETQTMCDLVVAAEDTPFKVHKTVLAASSDYFKTLLTIDMKEKGICAQQMTLSTIQTAYHTFTFNNTLRPAVISQTSRLVSQERLSLGAGTSVFIMYKHAIW